MKNFFSITAQNTIKKLQNKRLATVGIIGFESFETANLARRMVEYGNFIGLDRDQLFPEFLVIGSDCKDVRHLVDQAAICKDFGCDFVISSDIKDHEQKLSAMIKEMSGIDALAIKKGEQIESQTIDRIEKIARPKRPNLYYDESRDWKEQESQISRNLEADNLSRVRRFQERKKYSTGYSVLQNSEFVGVVGGAGPLASAALCEDLAKKGLSFVHHSATSAPGKHAFEMGQGPSYVPHYQSSMNFLCEMLNLQHVTIPCNTAHMRKEEFAGKYIDRIIDIRQATIDQNSNVDGYILLGTNRTTGVNLPKGNQAGIYAEFLLKNNLSDKISLITPNSTQQDDVMRAIFLVKAGKLSEANEIIENVCTDLRNAYGGDMPIIFGCTELPLANYSRTEMFLNHYIDPSLALAEAAKQKVISKSSEFYLANYFDAEKPSANPKAQMSEQVFSNGIIQSERR